MKIQHIPNLPNSDKALTLLKRIHDEFSTIALKHGWKINAVTEMCCCGDGIQHLQSSNGKKRNCFSKKKQTTMPENVWGYNQSTSRGYGCSIHLRLRMPKSHDEFIPYDSIAHTMAHEMAHCVYQSHSANFYELMEDIIRQHESFVTKGIVLDKSGFPLGSNQAYVLGGKCTSRDRKKGMDSLVRQRKSKSRLITGHILGGKTNASNKYSKFNKQSSLNISKSKKELLREAAEKRRLEDMKWCFPCDEIIELSDDESVEVLHQHNEITKTEKSATADNHSISRSCPKSSQLPSSNLNTPIDLTLDEYEDTQLSQVTDIGRRITPHRSAKSKLNSKSESTSESWTCKRCTYQNITTHNLITTQKNCRMCSMPLTLDQENSRIVKNSTKRQRIKQALNDQSKEEERRSKEQFQGFNIYGRSSSATSVLSHLT